MVSLSLPNRGPSIIITGEYPELALQSSTGDQFVQVQPHPTPGSAWKKSTGRGGQGQHADDAGGMGPNNGPLQGLHWVPGFICSALAQSNARPLV